MAVAEDRNHRKFRQGLVVSAKMDKAITVRIDRTIKHPRYNKVIRTFSKLYAHDETNDAREGDVVQVMETRPLSKLKRWRLVNVVERAK